MGEASYTVEQIIVILREVELLEKRAKGLKSTKNFLEIKLDECGMVSDEDAATYCKMEAGVMALICQIELLEYQQRMDAKFRSVADKPSKSPVSRTR